MARIGGRSNWIALPVGAICAAVVAVLVWMASPMVPVTVAWVGDSLRAATARAAGAAAPASTPGGIQPGGGIDCRDMYPVSLWTELVWTPQSLLAQTTAAPATSVEGLVDALAPTVERTCTWTAPAGSISSTLAVVAGDVLPVADAALRGQGFTCATSDAALECSRAQGAVVEAHVFRDGLWLSSLETSWQPEDYAARLAAFVWGS